jgi:hypothetical protein
MTGTELMEAAARLALAALKEAGGAVDDAREGIEHMRDLMAERGILPPEARILLDAAADLLGRVPGDWRLTILNVGMEWREREDAREAAAAAAAAARRRAMRSA